MREVQLIKRTDHVTSTIELLVSISSSFPNHIERSNVFPLIDCHRPRRLEKDDRTPDLELKDKIIKGEIKRKCKYIARDTVQELKCRIKIFSGGTDECSRSSAFDIIEISTTPRYRRLSRRSELARRSGGRYGGAGMACSEVRRGEQGREREWSARTARLFGRPL